MIANIVVNYTILTNVNTVYDNIKVITFAKNTKKLRKFGKKVINLSLDKFQGSSNYFLKKNNFSEFFFKCSKCLSQRPAGRRERYFCPVLSTFMISLSLRTSQTGADARTSEASPSGITCAITRLNQQETFKFKFQIKSYENLMCVQQSVSPEPINTTFFCNSR